MCERVIFLYEYYTFNSKGIETSKVDSLFPQYDQQIIWSFSSTVRDYGVWKVKNSLPGTTAHCLNFTDTAHYQLHQPNDPIKHLTDLFSREFVQQNLIIDRLEVKILFYNHQPSMIWQFYMWMVNCHCCHVLQA